MGALRVLMAEDDYYISEEIAAILKEMGCSVIAVAANGQKAVDLTQTLKPDLIFMDIRLPKLDGIEASRLIQKTCPTPVVIMTAYESDELLCQATDAGISYYLVKPPNKREMERAARIAVRRHQEFMQQRLLKEQLAVTNQQLEQEISKREQAEGMLKAMQDDLETQIAERTFALKLQTEQMAILKNQAESANWAKSEFLANISHELRNPMHHILAYSKYGVEKVFNVNLTKLLHYFSQIRHSALRLMLLLDNLLDLSKLEAGKMELNHTKNDLQTIVKDVIDEIQQTAVNKNLLLKMTVPDFCPVVVCDTLRINQVVCNLLSNAIKYSEASRTIYLSFARETFILEGIETPMFTVKIADEGVGIPEDELEKVFEKFVQSGKTKTGAGGTGLGLAISLEIIRAHKGLIWAENNPECGATFSFCLPAARE